MIEELFFLNYSVFIVRALVELLLMIGSVGLDIVLGDI
jgi:hypothetical protein